MIIAIYMNIIIIYSIGKKKINKIQNFLKARFHMSDLKLVLLYLKISIIYNYGNKFFF